MRSLVGLERSAAMRAFGDFLSDKTLSADQIQFVELIIDHLTERGAMDARVLYESPYTDEHPLGISGVFDTRHVAALGSILEEIRQRAAA